MANMSESADGPLLRFCDRMRIPIKKYPNCFHKKRRINHKTISAARPANRANVIYDHTTSTEESECSEDEDDYVSEISPQAGLVENESRGHLGGKSVEKSQERSKYSRKSSR